MKKADIEARLGLLEQLYVVIKQEWHDPNGEPCNCEMRVGNPMVSDHYPNCRTIRALLAELEHDDNTRD